MADNYKVFNLKVVYKDGGEAEVSCTYFGSSTDNEQFMMFVKGPLEAEGSFPHLLINVDVIATIELINIEEKEND